MDSKLVIFTHWLERKVKAKMKRAKNAITYMKENIDMNEHRIVLANNQ